MEDTDQRINIVIAADSLSLPRPSEQGDIRFKDTYGYLLSNSLKKIHEPIEVIIRGRRSNTIRYLDDHQNLYDEILAWEPQIVILQIGIVDCAPRIFSVLERKIVDRIRPVGLRDSFIHFAGKYRRFIITHRSQKVYVPLKEFIQGYLHVRDQLLEKGIVFLAVNICPTTLETAFRSPGLNDNIQAYNHVIADCTRKEGCYLIDLYRLILNLGPDENLLDGIHLNKAGNIALSNLLFQTISEIIKYQKTGSIARSIMNCL